MPWRSAPGAGPIATPLQTPRPPRREPAVSRPLRLALPALDARRTARIAGRRAQALARRRRRMGIWLRLAGLAAGLRLRRAPPGHPARPPPRAVPVVARQPRHAGMPRAGVRPGPGRLVPRPAVPLGRPVGARLLSRRVAPRHVHGRAS